MNEVAYPSREGRVSETQLRVRAEANLGARKLTREASLLQTVMVVSCTSRAYMGVSKYSCGRHCVSLGTYVVVCYVC